MPTFQRSTLPFCCLFLAHLIPIFSSLYPVENEARHVIDLGGLWTFVFEPVNCIGWGILHKWHLYDLSKFEVGFFKVEKTFYN